MYTSLTSVRMSGFSMPRLVLFSSITSGKIAPALVIFCLLLAGCGGGGAVGASVGSGGVSIPATVPTLTGIAPSTALVGSSAITIVASGSNFTDGATIQWNGTALQTMCAATNVGVSKPCASASATVPASDLAAVGSAKVNVSNPGSAGGTSSALNFTIEAPPIPKTWVRPVTGITVPWDEVWDSVRGKLYVSTAAQDPNHPSAIIAVDPVAGTAGTQVAAGDTPLRLALSSDKSYLWTSLVGSNSVQRFLLPALTQDISFSVPLDHSGGLSRR